MNDSLDSVIARWSSLGAGFGAAPHEIREIDLERLILDTVRHAPRMARLFAVSATWLHAYADTIAGHRLRRLIETELEPESRPVLGLLLDTAQLATHPRAFETIVRDLPAQLPEMPLFASARATTALADVARRRASEISRAWGLWMQPFEFRHDAIRSASWVMHHHPELRLQADFRGDLRASILAALRHDDGAGRSESALAEFAGGSRSQVRNALRNLEMTGRVLVRRAEGANRLSIRLRAPAA